MDTVLLDPPSTPPTGEPLVVQLHLPRRQLRRLVIISVLLPIGAVVIFVTDPTRTNGIYGGLAIGGLAIIWTVILAGRWLGRGTPNQLVATATEISAPACSLDWNRVASMRIGPLSGLAGRHLALWIEPVSPADIRWVESKPLRLLGMTQAPNIRIPAMNVDTPLDQLAAQLEARAGRPLLARP